MTETIASAFAITVGKDGHWLNPLAMAQLKHAVLSDQSTVVLNGVSYDIEYGKFLTQKHTGKEEYIVLTRTDGKFIPYGQISLKEIRAYRLEK